MTQPTDTMEKIVALCRRRGFIFGSSEIYGGIGGFWDYGPLGCELKKNIKDAWWNDMVRNPPPGPNGVEYQMVGLDCAIIMNPKVWEASGHVGGFSDPMVDDKETKERFRADQVYGAWLVGTSDNRDVRPDTMLLAKLAELPPQVTFVGITTADAVRAFFEKSKGQRALALLPVAENTFLAPMHSLVLRGPVTTVATVENKKLDRFELWVFAPVPLQTLEQLHDTIPSPSSGKTGVLTPPRQFNLMFKTHVGALEDASSIAYLRPETAQGIFANFKNVLDTSRVKIPFGIAQMGKAFRNEINPRNYTFRSREFEQMEIEFFCKPPELCRPGEPTSMDWYEFWRDVRIKWYESLNIKSEKLRPRQQGKEELAHYSSACTDIEYLFPFSDEPQELEGVAHRGDFDLKAHGKYAKGDENAFAVIDDSEPRSSDRAESPGAEGPRGRKSATRYVPHVIEPSAGVDRFALAAITEAYTFDESRASPEFMNFHPRLAPIKAAVFPLVNKDGMPEIAEPIYREIKKHFPCQYDAKQTIGKRYARMDEAGTPFCFTIDGQTKEDGTVTVRDRNDASQIRIDKSRCLEYLRDQLGL